MYLAGVPVVELHVDEVMVSLVRGRRGRGHHAWRGGDGREGNWDYSNMFTAFIIVDVYIFILKYQPLTFTMVRNKF